MALPDQIASTLAGIQANFRNLDTRFQQIVAEARGGSGSFGHFATSSGLAAHETDSTDVHGIADTTVLATDAEVASAVSTHDADTTSVHGIADTSLLARKNTKADLPASVAYEDEANVFDQQQEISTLSSSGVGFRVKHPSSSTSDDSRLDRGELVIQKTVAGGTILISSRAGDVANRFRAWDNGLVEAGDGTVVPVTAGFRSINSIAGTPDANTFIKKQIIAPDSDTQALDLRVGTGSTAPFRLRNNADSANLASFTNVGKLNAIGAGFGSARVEAVGDAAAAGDAVSRGFGDARYLPLTTGGQGTVWPTQGQPLAPPTSTAAGATDRYRYCTVIVAQKCTVTGIRYKVGATSAGLVGSTLYNTAGSLVSGALVGVAQAAINTRQEVPFGAASLIEPGLYTALLRFTDTTATAFCWAAADFLGVAGEGSGTTPGTQLPPSGLTTVPVLAITLY